MLWIETQAMEDGGGQMAVVSWLVKPYQNGGTLYAGATNSAKKTATVLDGSWIGTQRTAMLRLKTCRAL
jgi:hypothetical protein